jgi:heat shock protein 5
MMSSMSLLVLFNLDSNYLFLLRRLLGPKFDQKFKEYIKTLPYDVVDQDGKPTVSFGSWPHEIETHSAEEITSMILLKLKIMAETFLGRKVSHAVVTVPVNYNDNQREAMKNAGKLIGLTILRLVNEPTAACIAHGLDRVFQEKNILVYNLGAKDQDATVLSVDFGVFEILSNGSDRNLSGEDFDATLLKFVVDQINQGSNIDITKDSEAMRLLKHQVESAEEKLISESFAQINFAPRYNTKGFFATITKTQLQDLNKHLFDKTLTLVEKALKKAKLGKKEIDHIIFTGDPVHIARVQPFLEEYFDGKKALNTTSPDEAVVRGAAIQGRVLGSEEGVSQCPPMYDVTPLSLGIETAGGVFTKVIPRNYVIPTRKVLNFSTATDNQDRVILKVVEGERPMAYMNTELGVLEIRGFPRKPAGFPIVEVAFEMDVNFQLTVNAKDLESGRAARLVIPSEQGIVGYSDGIYARAAKVVEEAEKNFEDDKLVRGQASFREEDVFGVDLLQRVPEEGSCGYDKEGNGPYQDQQPYTFIESWAGWLGVGNLIPWAHNHQWR